MKNIEMLENQLALGRLRDSGEKMDIEVSYAIASNMIAMEKALDPYIEERKKLEEKHRKEDGTIDAKGMEGDEDFKRLNEIEVDCDIRKVPIEKLPKEISVQDMIALHFMLEN